MNLLSDLTIYSKYAKFNKTLNRRENWNEIVKRYEDMMIKKYPHIEEQIKKHIILIYNKKILPSLRGLQFGGKAIEKTPNRIFNCAFTTIDSTDAFGEILFLLLCGNGVGFSVQKIHIDKLNSITEPKLEQRYLVSDTIEGWANSVKHLIQSYTNEFHYKPIFDFSDIRPSGSELSTGGLTTGYQPLKDMLEKVDTILKNSVGRKLKPIEIHDIVCHISDCVLSGGIRRSSLISFFDKDDQEMLLCKSGNWWETNIQRSRSNNSAVLLRSQTTKEDFERIFNILKNSGSGEPAFYFTNDKNILSNPCGEISLKPNQLCNLTTINASTIENEEDFIERALAATFFGTLQAGFTDFYYLRPSWKINSQEDALLGVSLTGICNSDIEKYNIELIVDKMKEYNKEIAIKININPSARITTIKPEGTSSCVLETSSGIHANHSRYYLRTLRFNNSEKLVDFIKSKMPEIVESEYYNPLTTSCVRVPIKANQYGTFREQETAIDALERVKRFSKRWIHQGHNKGINHHNCSVTINVKENEWDSVKEWMWANRESYYGISILPYDGGIYKQAPFEEITEDVYNKYVDYIKDINFDDLYERTETNFIQDTVACGGGSCELR